MTSLTLLDGGFSREILRFGAELTQPEWSAGALMTHPEAVQKAHESFFRAGAQIATTNTYAVVPFHIGRDRFDAEGEALATLAGRLARSAADGTDGGQVAGSLPPACGSYQPGAFDPAEAAGILDVLVRGLTPYVDLWLAETMSSLKEARTTARTVAGSDKPLWISYSLRDEAGDEARTPALRSGETVEAAVELARDLGAAAVLFNCSMPEVMEPAIRIAAQSGLPVGVYANAFTARAADDAANESLSDMRDDMSPPDYLIWSQTWVDAGATIIGGCCGIGSDHIAVLRDQLTPRG